MVDIVSEIKAIEAKDKAGTIGGGSNFGPPGLTSAAAVSSLTGMTALTFPQGLGDDPRQPFFMSFVPKKILSAVGGTMGDMSFQSVSVTKNNIAQVALPIPTGINATYAQGWDQTDVNAVQGALMQSGAVQTGAKMARNLAQENDTFKVQDAMDACYRNSNCRSE